MNVIRQVKNDVSLLHSYATPEAEKHTALSNNIAKRCFVE